MKQGQTQDTEQTSCIVMKILKKIISVIIWGVVGFFSVSVLIILIAVIAGVRLGEDDFSGLKIKTDRGVGVVEVSGEIISSTKFRESMKKALDDKKVKAVVVRIDSPGGSVGISEEMYREIKRADEKKPMVCSLGNTAASGGLYAAMGCRKIVTNEGTLTGSIGVILIMPNFTSLISRAGFEMNIVKSGRFKDTGSPFRELDSRDKELLQSLVDRTYEQFLRKVAESRKLTVENVREFADGRIILGEEAVERGLVDEIGGIDRAAKLALELAGIEGEPEIVTIKKSPGFLGLLDDLRESKTLDWLLSLRRVRLLYQAYM